MIKDGFPMADRLANDPVVADDLIAFAHSTHKLGVLLYGGGDRNF